jgi:hypothetical protein
MGSSWDMIVHRPRLCYSISQLSGSLVAKSVGARAGACHRLVMVTGYSVMCGLAVRLCSYCRCM